MSGEDASKRYYEKFWQELERDKVQQTVWYVNNVINEIQEVSLSNTLSLIYQPLMMDEMSDERQILR